MYKINTYTAMPRQPILGRTRFEKRLILVIGSIADGVSRGAEAVADALAAPFSEPVIRLGVTGLSRSGKTVFITSLVANLMNRGRMPQLLAASSGAIQAAYLQPQPDDTVPRFRYEDHLARLTAPEPNWPDGTKRISELRLSLKVQPTGLLAGLSGPRTVHIDIVDYPGEWLLDLALLEKSYAEWSEGVLKRMIDRPGAEEYFEALDRLAPEDELDEVAAQRVAGLFSDHLIASKAAGFSDCSPGRFLLPGELLGSPVLTFAPLPAGVTAPRGSLRREFERRFESYKKHVVKPFFREHFAKIDRQIVLVDVLGAIHAGPPAFEDLRHTMAEILSVFRPGRNRWLSRILGRRRVEKILFAATKADHLHHVQHPQLTAITEALLRDAKDRAEFAGAGATAMSIAAYRATVEDRVEHEGVTLDVVRGRLAESGRQAALFAGALPEDPAHLLSPARQGTSEWLNAQYRIMNFAPVPLVLRPGDGPPHIRLDKAMQFLIGDRL